jgi:uncharacterized protein YecT (DUF1311 family)
LRFRHLVSGEKLNKYIAILLVMGIAGCSQKQEIACSGESSTAVMSSLLKDTLIKRVTETFASQEAANANVDRSLIRATIDKVAFKIEDVMTTKSDPNSTKKFCQSSLKVVLPTDVIGNADATRAILSLNDAHQGALQAGVEFEADTIKSSFDYNVQPTDDGKKVYGSMEGNNPALAYTSTVIEQALFKSALEKQKAAQAQQQQQEAMRVQQQQEAVAQAQAAETQATLQKAQADIKAANDAINVVWNAGSKEWRQSMLPEQRLWLAQRENDCKIKALDSGSADSSAFQISKLNCETQMTADRTQILKTALQQSLAQANTSSNQ